MIEREARAVLWNEVGKTVQPHQDGCCRPGQGMFYSESSKEPLKFLNK